MSMDVPPDQNTAPVLEFRCLYTADTRRKQKRWQDGRLKYHTFNKRIMVFDERSNLVGDTHWREKARFDEGAELELERNGILVEVSEFLERREQDLTELIDKRVKKREERFIARNGDSSPSRSATSVIRSQSIAAAHLKPKPLNSILGAPSGHYGKALVPNKSPFEQRQMLYANDTDENETPRPAKRRKANEPLPSKSGFAQNLMGATLSFTPVPSSTGPIRYDPLKLKSIQRSESNNNKEDGDNNRDAPSTRKQRWLGEDMTRDMSPPKIRIPQRKRDKPEKSGYASNLTGASLSLSSFRDATPKHTERNPNLQKNQPKTIDLSMNTSSGEDSPSASIHKPKEAIRSKKKPRADSSEQTSRLPSPPAKVTTVPKSAAKLLNKRQESQKYVSPIDQAPERSHSSLRIKSRPRNRMLMLLDQPSSPSPTLAMEQGTTRSTKLDSVIPVAKVSSDSRSSPLALKQDITKSAKLDPRWSTATSSLPHRPSIGDKALDDASNDAGGDSGDGYNNGVLQMPAFPHDLDFSDFEEPVSSLADIGINREIVDAILFRTRPPEIQKTIPNFTLALEEQRNSRDENHFRSRDLEEGLRQPELNHLSSLDGRLPQITKKHTQNHDYILQTAPKFLSEVSGATERQITDSVGPSKDANLDRASTDKQPKSNARPLVEESDVKTAYESTNKPNTPNTESLITSNLAEKTSVALRTSASELCAFQKNSVVPKATIHSNLAGKMNPNILLPIPDTIAPKAVVENGEAAISSNGASSNIIESDKVLVGITPNGSTFNSSGLFRANLVPKSNQYRMEVVPIKTTSSLIDQPATFHPVSQACCDNVEIKQSPSSIPGILPIEQTINDDISGFMSANQIVEKEAQRRILEASSSGNHGLSRPRIINPATRGMSIQKTAKRTLHALAPAVNQMGPTAAIFRGLGSGNNTTNYTSANNVGFLGNNTSCKGPWSRESFDLFGSWRPPVQQPQTNTLSCSLSLAPPDP